MEKHEFIATCTRGLEEISIREVEELIHAKAKPERAGAIRFEANLEAIYVLNYVSRSLHRIILLLTSGNFQKLNDIYKMIREVDLTKYINDDQSFAIRAQRIGDHDFTSLDLARVAGQAVIDNFSTSKGKRPKVDLDNPDVILRAEVEDDWFFLGLDTTGDGSLHRRGYRIYQHPAPLKPTLAYSLVRIANWKERDSLIDPMCGSGTILIEAARYAMKIPAAYLRKSFAFQKLKFFSLDEFRKVREKYNSLIEEKELKIEGCDLFKKHVDGAKLNAERAGVKIKFFRGDATKIKLDYDVIITNPPYGLRIASKGVVKKLYEGFAENLKRGNWRKLVMLTAESKLFLEYFRREPTRKIKIVYGNLPTEILLFNTQNF